MHPTPTLLRALALLALALLTLGCPKDNKDDKKAPPPPTAPTSSSSSSKVCAAGGGLLQDPSALMFPRHAGGYCIDPNGETRVFGEGAKKPLDAVCTEAFDGECEVYKNFGLRSVTTFRYVDGAGTAGSVEVILSRFASADGAYGMFTKRVVGDSDPADPKAPKDMNLPVPGALGTGSVYLWKGSLFVELTYTNENETPAKVAESSGKVLPAIGSEVATRMPGSTTPPAPVQALPSKDRLPFGILFEPKDAFEVSGAGSGAYGYYKDSEKRYRMLSITRGDVDQAKDVMQSLLKRKGAAMQQAVGESAVRLMTGEKDSARMEWLIARAGKQVLGVGDEPLVVKPEMSPEERNKVCLSREQKQALLKQALAPGK